MKVNRFGRASILTPSQINLLCLRVAVLIFTPVKDALYVKNIWVDPRGYILVERPHLIHPKVNSQSIAIKLKIKVSILCSRS